MVPSSSGALLALFPATGGKKSEDCGAQFMGQGWKCILSVHVALARIQTPQPHPTAREAGKCSPAVYGEDEGRVLVNTIVSVAPQFQHP